MGKPMCDDHDIEDDGVDLEDSLSEGLMERIDMEICFRDRFCILLCLGHRCPLLQRVKDECNWEDLNNRGDTLSGGYYNNFVEDGRDYR
ncbi:hypothetical protein V6N13_004994 [Hibiscus sabdariffa]